MRVRIVGIKEYTVKGKRYRYWRRKGCPKVRIDPALKGAALAAEIDRLEKKHLSPVARAGTLRSLVTKFEKESQHYKGLSQRTMRDYTRVFKWLEPALDIALVDFTTPEIVSLRNEATEQHEPKFANLVVAVLRHVFKFGKQTGDTKNNPAEDVEKAVGGNLRPNRPCTPQEAVALLAASPVGLKPVIGIALYTGLRLGDIAALTKSSIKGDWLELVQSKTRRSGKPGKVLRVFICEDLKWILEGIPYSKDVETSSLLVKENGRPWKYEGIKTAFQRLRDGLEKPLEGEPRIGQGVTFHGLRHTVGTILDEAGFDEWEVGHQLGHGAKSVTGKTYMSAEREGLLKSMALTVEDAYRNARGNVVKMERPKNRAV